MIIIDNIEVSSGCMLFFLGKLGGGGGGIGYWYMGDD